MNVAYNAGGTVLRHVYLVYANVQSRSCPQVTANLHEDTHSQQETFFIYPDPYMKVYIHVPI